ncbi:MAG: phosphoenolpyruvate--protein phosphotransferase [Myxococcota bacterium]|nr:phosphoenolpyruvate--protein phosphotransferase [Myxococcota bacterium]
MSIVHPPIGARETLAGIGVSPGYAIGPAYFVDRRKLKVPHQHLDVGQIENEVSRFEAAISVSETQLKILKSKLAASGDGHDLILDAHQLMLRDEMLLDGTVSIIKEQHINAEWALKKVLRSLRRVFDELDDEYFRERRADIDFVGDRILRNLLGKDEPTLSNLTPNSIVIARDLSPSDTAQLLGRSVLGFVTEVGSRTSHTAIMARSFELPAVVAVDGLTDRVGTGDLLVVDGSMGRVHIRPTPDDIAHYRRRQTSFNDERAKLETEKLQRAQTLDGHDVDVLGNIELPNETTVVLEHGAQGVGLYRTEFLYMNREDLPTEVEQYEAYRRVVEACKPHGATIRTLDLGGDKLPDYALTGREANPVLGLRAIRLCMREYSIFKTQVRALLRASAHGQLRIMVPLISRLDEVHFVKNVIAQCRRELIETGLKVADQIPLGVMIEVPAAALIAHHLAAEVDFFSVGTNDLAQYCLAVDRANPLVAPLYAPLHPAMIHLLRLIADAGHQAGIKVTMCGEMAGEALCLPIVLGLGFQHLSMNPTSIPLIKAMVRCLSLEACTHLVGQVERLSTSEAVEEMVKVHLKAMVHNTEVESILESLFDDPSMMGESLDEVDGE